jgi:hypothetical protein
MARDISNIEIRDTEQYQFTIKQAEEKSVYQYANNLDVEVDVVVKGTYAADDDFSDAYELAFHTISSGGTEAGALTDSWDVIQVSVQASSTPSSGSFIAKQH